MKKKKIIIILSSILLVIVLLFSSFFIYVGDYYKADNYAKNVLKTNERLKEEKNMCFIKSKESSDIGICFYPGAKVEYTAYLPLLDRISENYSCALLKMPFNLAIMDSNAMDKVFKKYPSITRWYICGHSMGGASASMYASTHQDKIEGLILLGAYKYKDYPLSKTLTIYGSLNTSCKDKVNYSENVVEIEGGNHANFGNYGKQKGDAEALIPSSEQQRITVEAIVNFIGK